MLMELEQLRETLAQRSPILPRTAYPRSFMPSSAQLLSAAAELEGKQRCHDTPDCVLHQNQPLCSRAASPQGEGGGGGICAATEAWSDNIKGSDAAGGGDQRSLSPSVLSGPWQSAAASEEGGRGVPRQQSERNLCYTEQRGGGAAAESQDSIQLNQPPDHPAGEQLRYQPAAALAAMNVRGWGGQSGHIKGALRCRAPHSASETTPSFRFGSAYPSDAAAARHSQAPAYRAGNEVEHPPGNLNPRRSSESAHWQAALPSARRRSSSAVAVRRRQRDGGGGVSDIQDVVFVARARPPAASASFTSTAPLRASPCQGSPARGESAPPPPGGPTPLQPRAAQFERQQDMLLAEVTISVRTSNPATPARAAAAALIAGSHAEPDGETLAPEADW